MATATSSDPSALPEPRTEKAAYRDHTLSIDTEFITEDFTRTGLISIALTDGKRELYAVNRDMDWEKATARPWMVHNVVRHLPLTADGTLNADHPDVISYETIAIRVKQFMDALRKVGPPDTVNRIRLIAHCGAQDMARLHGLWNHDWAAMPRSIPTSFKDVREERMDAGLGSRELPPMEDESLRHHALHDARHELRTFQWLQLVKAVGGQR